MIWCCQYHVVWVPKYRYRILDGVIATEANRCIRAFAKQKQCEVIGLNIQQDHVYWLVMIPPKVSISDFVGIVKAEQKFAY